MGISSRSSSSMFERVVPDPNLRPLHRKKRLNDARAVSAGLTAAREEREMNKAQRRVKWPIRASADTTLSVRFRAVHHTRCASE